MFVSLASEKIMHRNFNTAYEYVHGIVSRGVQGERLITLLLGPPRAGKSLILQLLLEDFPLRTQDGHRVIPVIRVPTPVRPTKKAMAEAIVEALDSRKYGRQSADQMTSRARFLLTVAQTRVIIFDEIQHVVERHSSKSWYEVADWLKTLSDELNLTLVLVGLPSAREIITVNHQLRDRADPAHILYPYNWNRKPDIAEFCRCLLSVGEILVQQGWRVPNLSDLGLVRRFYASSLGRYGMVVKLLDTARHIAQSSQVITADTLYHAHRLSIGTDAEGANPFDPDAVLEDSVLVQRYVALLNESGLSVTSAAKGRKSSAKANGAGYRGQGSPNP